MQQKACSCEQPNAGSRNRDESKDRTGGPASVPRAWVARGSPSAPCRALTRG